MPSLLEVLKNNKHYEYPQKIFDIGAIFRKDGKEETGVAENYRLGVALCAEDADFTKIRQVLDYLMRNMDKKYEVVDVEHDSFIAGRIGRVIVDGKKVAYIGEVSPAVLANWELEVPTAVFELNLTELFSVM